MMIFFHAGQSTSCKGLRGLYKILQLSDFDFYEISSFPVLNGTCFFAAMLLASLPFVRSGTQAFPLPYYCNVI